MAINRQDSRHRIKRTNLTGVVPTAHTASTDFTDGTWLNTDIREAEFFYNIPDKKLWIGTGTSSIEIAQIGSTTSGNSLEQTLSIGNNSGTNNIIMGTATVIKSDNTGGRIALDASSVAGEVYITTDDGSEATSYLKLSGSGQTAELAGIPGYSYISIGGNSQWFSMDNVTFNSVKVELNSSSTVFNVNVSDDASGNGGDTIKVVNNVNNNVSSDTGDKLATIIGSNNGTIGTASYNTVILGGTNMIANTSNSVYVPDLYIQTNKSIKSTNGGGQIDLDYFSSSGEVSITTDGGAQSESYLYMTPTDFTLSNQFGNISSKSSGIRLNHSSKVSITTDNIFTVYGSFNGSTSLDVILLNDNFSTPSNSSWNDMPGVFIGSQNSTINAGVYNSVVLGGTGLTAISSNTVYVPDLRIQTGKSISFNYSTLTTDTVSTTTIGTFSIATITMVDDQSLSIRGQANGYCAYPNRNMGATFFASFIKYGGTIFQNGTTDIVLKDGYGDGTTPRVWTDGTNIFISIRTFSILTSKFTTSYEILST